MSALGEEARRLARSQTSAVLSTLSQRLTGYPFGSVAPYVLDHAGRPVLLISDLAEHTRNLQADPRCSLIVQPYSDDMQATGRVTIVGKAERLLKKDALGPRYLRHHPQAEGYFAMHDFAFWRLEPLRIRYIGGFGRIHWIEADAYLLPEGPLAGQEADILAHMNADHVHNLVAYCRHVHGVEVERAEMIGIDPDGFDLKADGRMLRFDFPSPVSDAIEARAALVELARQCRA
ncbi:MAG: HugZ family pyridoxamine 5'-phosphate oxidase [Thiobacillaceae bacterium]